MLSQPAKAGVVECMHAVGDQAAYPNTHDMSQPAESVWIEIIDKC